MNSKTLPAALLLFFASYGSFCQFAQRMDITGGSIAASYTVVPTRSFKDTSGGFGYQAVGVNVNVPLFGNTRYLVKKTLQTGTPAFYEVSAHGGFQSIASTIGVIQYPRNLYDMTAGLGALWYNGNKNIFIADAGVGIAADQYVVQNGDRQYRFMGSFVVDNLHSQTLSVFYGAALTYAYGKPLPLPVLGLRKKFSRTWSVTMLLPLSVDFNDWINKDMSLHFLARPSGNRFQLLNKGNFDSASTTIYMQLRQFELGAFYLYRFAKHFTFSAEAGLLGAGHLKFTDMSSSKETLYETGLKGGTKFRLSVRYSFLRRRVISDKIDFENEIFRMY